VLFDFGFKSASIRTANRVNFLAIFEKFKSGPKGKIVTREVVHCSNLICSSNLLLSINVDFGKDSMWILSCEALNGWGNLTRLDGERFLMELTDSTWSTPRSPEINY
jgi:hypothetical protein